MEFEARVLEFSSLVTGLVTAHAWEGQVSMRAQDPVLHPADSSPGAVSKTQVPAPAGLQLAFVTWLGPV